MNWGHWPLERMLFLFVGIAFLSTWVQVTLSHYRQNFHHKAMWAPVLAAPVFSLTALLITITRSEWLLSVFLYLMWLGLLIGGLGSYFHLHGVGLRVGGYTMRNFLTGPPVTMPLMFSALSVLGLIAYYWR